jgi:hypothetical protein
LKLPNSWAHLRLLRGGKYGFVPTGTTGNSPAF